MRILAIDAGNKESGYAIIEMPEFKIIDFGKVDNEKLLSMFDTMPKIDAVAMEMVACYGMPVGKDVFDTCVWIGQFVHALRGQNINYIYRKDEKITLCGSMKAKDSNIRQALINRYAKHDFKNGKGVKKNQDVFYGVSRDIWQAIAVGVTYYETRKTR
jgi:hypothetical protein